MSSYSVLVGCGQVQCTGHVCMCACIVYWLCLYVSMHSLLVIFACVRTQHTNETGLFCIMPVLPFQKINGVKFASVKALKRLRSFGSSIHAHHATATIHSYAVCRARPERDISKNKYKVLWSKNCFVRTPLATPKCPSNLVNWSPLIIRHKGCLIWQRFWSN